MRLTGLRDGYLPDAWCRRPKDAVEALARELRPDLVLCDPIAGTMRTRTTGSPRSWPGTAFRDHLVLEYEIPKWDGDLGPAHVYRALPETTVAPRKIDLLHGSFPAARSARDWFAAETFRALARLRGMEPGSPMATPKRSPAAKLPDLTMGQLRADPRHRSPRVHRHRARAGIPGRPVTTSSASIRISTAPVPSATPRACRPSPRSSATCAT